MSIDSTSVQLIFAGEVLDGFSPADVKQRLAQRLKLDEARLRSLFSGQRVVVKRGLDAAAASHWVAQFRDMGARLHIVSAAGDARTPALAPPPPPVPTPAPAPLSLTPIAAPPHDPYAAPAPAPIAVNTPLPTEEITCPSCGERQLKRILCRSCACDMPRGIAAREEEAAAERARRRDEAMARRGIRRPDTSHASTASSRFAASRYAGSRFKSSSDDDAPLFGMSFDGRIGRLRYLFSGLLTAILLVWLCLLAATMPSRFTFALLMIGLAFVVVWGCRQTAQRLHDIGHSGWWLLLLFVPYLGGVVNLVLLLWPGSDDDNHYGSPPSPHAAMPVIAALLALCASAGIAARWGMSAFERQLAQMQEESEQEDGAEVDSEVPLPPASELARVLHSDIAVDEFRRYMSAPAYRAFAVSSAGAWGWHSGAARPDQAIETAIADCERRRAPYTASCHVVHLNDQWAFN